MIGCSFSYQGERPVFSLDVYAERYEELPSDERVAAGYGHVRRFCDELWAVDPNAQLQVKLEHRPQRQSRAGLVRGVTAIKLTYWANAGDCFARGPLHRRRQTALWSKLDELSREAIQLDIARRELMQGGPS